MKLTTLNAPLLLPEYGRNVQTMVKFLLTIEDRDLRNAQAKMVVATMANIYPHARRDTPEFRNMLYDHLFVISNFELDVDCPFQKPDPAQFTPVPEALPYSQHYVTQKQYGAIVPRLARELCIIQDEQMRVSMATSLARFMRQKSYDYNQEYPSNEIIISDLYDMTNGRVRLESSAFDGVELTVRQVRSPKRQRSKNSKSQKNYSKHQN